MAYGFGSSNVPYDVLLVWDLGGGTLDLTVVEAFDGIMEVRQREWMSLNAHVLRHNYCPFEFGSSRIHACGVYILLSCPLAVRLGPSWACARSERQIRASAAAHYAALFHLTLMGAPHFPAPSHPP